MGQRLREGTGRGSRKSRAASLPVWEEEDNRGAIRARWRRKGRI